MTESARTTVAVENPFSTERIRPGVIPFLFSHEDETTDPERLQDLITRWQTGNCLGQIVGPHGCGKSTLAFAIANQVTGIQDNQIESAVSVTIRRGRPKQQHEERTIPRWLSRLVGEPFHFQSKLISKPTGFEPHTSPTELNRHAIAIVDGIEQLPLVARSLLLRSFQSRRIPLLITTHRDVIGMPLLSPKVSVVHRPHPDVRVFIKIVSMLTGPQVSANESEIEECFRSENGNYRDSLMRLYDSFSTISAAHVSVRNSVP